MLRQGRATRLDRHAEKFTVTQCTAEIHLLGVEAGAVAAAGVEAEVGAANGWMGLNWLPKEQASWALGRMQGWTAGWPRPGPGRVLGQTGWL